MHIVEFYYDHSSDHIRNFEILPEMAKIYQNNNFLLNKQLQFTVLSLIRKKERKMADLDLGSTDLGRFGHKEEETVF